MLLLNSFTLVCFGLGLYEVLQGIQLHRKTAWKDRGNEKVKPRPLAFNSHSGPEQAQLDFISSLFNSCS